MLAARSEPAYIIRYSPSTCTRMGTNSVEMARYVISESGLPWKWTPGEL